MSENPTQSQAISAMRQAVDAVVQQADLQSDEFAEAAIFLLRAAGMMLGSSYACNGASREELGDAIAARKYLFENCAHEMFGKAGAIIAASDDRLH